MPIWVSAALWGLLGASSLILGAAVAMVVGLAAAVPALRVRGVNLAIVTLAAAATALLFTIHGSAVPAPGCIDATVPSTTGGAAIHACGAQARAQVEEARACRGSGGIIPPPVTEPF